MSNEQPGYPPPPPGWQPPTPAQPQHPQQPQYPQRQYPQPQYSQALYGGVPGPPPPRPPRRGGPLRTALIVVLSVLGSVILVVCVLAAIGIVTSSRDSQASGPTAPSAGPTGQASANPTGAPPGEPTVPTSRPTTRPTTAVPTTGPVRCLEGYNVYCMPKATMASAAALLKTKGVTCQKSDNNSLKCIKGSKAETIQIGLEPAALQPPGTGGRLQSLDAMTFSNGPGDNARGQALVKQNLQRSMKTILQTALPGDPFAAQVMKWLPTDLEKCTNAFVRIAGYDLKCDAPTRFSIQQDDGTVISSWSASFTIMAA